MKVSVIIPAHNEEKNIPILMEKFNSLFERREIEGEVILVNDGSTDNTYQLTEECRKKYSFLKVVHHSQKMGVTKSLVSGFNVANYELYIFIGADLEVLPEEIPKFIDEIKKGKDVVCGWMQGLSKKPISKRIVSFLYNSISRKLFGIKVHHMNSPKAFKRKVIEEIPLRKDWHRYIVQLAQEKGFRIGEVKVQFYPRKYGEIKYKGVGRILIGILDLMAIKFHTSFIEKPLLFFGGIGIALIIGALGVGVLALYLRFALERGYRPLLYLVIFLSTLGVMLFVLGFLGETISNIEEEIKKLSQKLTKKNKNTQL
jgi:glycosyltransferase involved in cell wall biosynthesis